MGGGNACSHDNVPNFDNESNIGNHQAQVRFSYLTSKDLSNFYTEQDGHARRALA